MIDSYVLDSDKFIAASDSYRPDLGRCFHLDLSVTCSLRLYMKSQCPLKNSSSTT